MSAPYLIRRRLAKTCVVLVMLTASSALAVQPASAAPPPPAARPGDVDSIEHLVTALYQTISGPAGAPRQWDRLRSLFWPGGRMGAVRKGPDGASRIQVFDVESFIARSGEYLKTHPFYERGVANRVEGFGPLASVQSLYESRHAPGEAPFARGVNSLQLANDGHRWWLINIFWAEETPEAPLPPDRLPPPREWR